jgi:Ferric reductase like transmembrane component
MTQKQITRYIFWPLQIAVVVLIFVNAYLIFNQRAFAFQTVGEFNTPLYYSYGMILGLIAFTLFSIAILPGMLGRFGIKGEIVKQLTIYRREFGKLMFLFAFAHYTTIKIFPLIALNSTPTVAFFENFGFLALTLTIPLFLTSTNWAQRRLGKWWKRLHKLVYIIVWLVFFHVAFAQGFTIISGIIFFIAAAETLSLLNYYIVKFNLE